MVRAPCCEKTGLKKGPWTPEEDNILISYINIHGHPNWRSLPKQAGLLRCGKSCRLRWTNYLRPDIKRGNFTADEERTIIHLHQTLGNRWSVIASKLPGRTDNEIKNVWHTHLKKKLNNNYTGQVLLPKSSKPVSNSDHDHDHEIQSDLTIDQSTSNYNSTHEVNSSATTINNHMSTTESMIISDQDQIGAGDIVDVTLTATTTTFPELIDESFLWSEDFMSTADNQIFRNHDYEDFQFDFSTPADLMSTTHDDHVNLAEEEEGMDFWYNLFIKAGLELIF